MSIYLDYQSTTPCDPRVVDVMLPYFNTHFGNPNSRNHTYGWAAEQAVDQARLQVATLIGAEAKEIIWTSGATEANNLALLGTLEVARKRQKHHLITCVIEHKCVLETARYLEQQGVSVTYLPVQSNGLLDLQTLEAAMTPETALVSILTVHNEIGIVQPIAQIGALCRSRGILFHTDAAQAAGKIPISVDDWNVDLMSLSSHKMYGPKGIGALFVRKRGSRVRLAAQMHGGGQERGMRSGTLPTPLCVGMGQACAIAQQDMILEQSRIRTLAEHFWNSLSQQLPHIHLNGHTTCRYPGNLNISFACVEGESLMMHMPNLAVSSGSACTSASLEPSYVLRSLGVNEALAHTSIRFGIGRFTTRAEIDEAIDSVVTAVQKLRAISPLWEMVEAGVDLESIQWTSCET
jgi:cysteine desulfurase